MREVFISYSFKDKELAQRLVVGLESHGARCWVAPRDIPSGGEWAAEITRAIRSTAVFLLVYTAHSNESDDVVREVTLAANTRSQVIPVRFEDVPFSESLQYLLATTQWHDLTPDLSAADVAGLARDLSRMLAEHRSTEESSPRPPTEPIAAPAAEAEGSSSPGDIVYNSNPQTVTPLPGRRWEKQVRVEFGPRAGIFVGIIVVALAALIFTIVIKVVNWNPPGTVEEFDGTPATVPAGENR